tara:strand:+ start:151 stop:348 length:198 start_codon:yes stop_codon:yes gene_type:complete
MNNPPAFPNEGFNGWGNPFQGMTLRDYFAAKALQGLLASDVNAPMQSFAIRAYKMADAMLKAREA